MTTHTHDGKGKVDCHEDTDGKMLQMMPRIITTNTDDSCQTVSHDKESQEIKSDKGPPWWKSQRYILGYFIFGGSMNIFFQRFNFSIAIVCMVNHTAVSLTHHSSDHFLSNVTDLQTKTNITLNLPYISKEPPQNNFLKNTDFNKGSNPVSSDEGVSFGVPPGSSEHSPVRPSSRDKSSCSRSLSEQEHEDGPFVWDKELQGLLLGAVYWTYVVVQIPGNLLLKKMKRKTLIVLSMTGMSLTSFLMHGAALWSPWAVFLLKLFQGVTTALSAPILLGLWEDWAPPDERGTLISFGLSGQMLANILVFPSSALLCKYGFLGGWPSVFYVFGALSLLWVALFLMFTDESPSTSRFITDEEKNYITKSLSRSQKSKAKKRPPIPWLAILTSGAFWGVVCAHISFTWGHYLFLSTLPQYIFEVLKFDIKSNGFFSMLPYILLFISTMGSGQLSDLAIKKKWLTRIQARRAWVCMANVIPAIGLIGMSYMDCTQPGLAIILLVVSVGFTGFAISGFVVNPYDIAPRFAVAMITISSSVSQIPGFATPYVVAALTKDQTREQWQMVFFLTAAVLTAGAFGFCVLARGEVQKWAGPKEGDDDFDMEINIPQGRQVEQETFLNGNN